jgi:hypothetical protein
MATKKISELTALTSPDGAEELLINDGGTSKKITITNATASKLPLAGGTMTGNISHASHFTLDVGGNITLDADNGFVKFADGGTDIAQFAKGSNSNLEIKSLVSDADILFQGNDGNSAITAMTIDMSEGGNVGIGDTTPESKLKVKSNALTSLKLEMDGVGAPVAQIYSRSGVFDSDVLQIYSDRTSSSAFNFLKVKGDVDGTEFTPFIIRGDGNVGIGTSSPNSKVSIVGAGDNLSAISNNRDNYALGFTTASTTNYFASSIGWSESEGDNITAAIGNYDAGTTGGPTGLWFATGNTTTLSEAMRINHSGNVGIRTTNIGTSSHNFGGQHNLTLGGATANSFSVLEIAGNDADDGAYIGAIEFVNKNNSDAGSGTAEGIAAITTIVETGDSNAQDDSGGHLQFWTKAAEGNLSEKMRLDSSGNVGIGVTPESWHSSYTALELKGGAALWSYNTSTEANTFLSSNAFYDGSHKYIADGEAISYFQTSSGKHEFNVATSGSADGTITWTTAMTINNDEDIVIGDFSTSGATGGIRLRYDDYGDGSASIYTSAVNTATRAQFYFYNPNGQVGTITTNGSATAYNTSSDYRLKENVVPMTGSIDRLKELKPSQLNFIADATTTVDGFLAHEAQEVVPEAITGTKDAMQTEEYTVSEALGEVFTPAVEEVTESNIVTPAVEAQDAVMGERQVTETVETGSYVNLAGETIIETSEVGVTEEATETVVERQTGEDGITREVEVERTVNVPVMETYEKSPAIEAVAEVTETVVTTEAVAEVILETDVEKPEEPTEGQWRETTAKVTAEREVPDMQGIDQGKLVPLLVGALQEAIARIETLENT